MIILTFFSYIIFINCHEDEFNLIIQEYESNISQLKLISCFNLIHSFLSQRDGDQRLKKFIKSSKISHDKLFIKFLTSSIKHCSDKINSDQMNYLLTQENIDNYNTLNSSITNLIKLNKEINNADLTEEEEFIYNKISKKLFSQEIKNKKNKQIFQQSKIILFTILIIIGSILFYLRYVKLNKKIRKNSIEKNINEINKKSHRKKKKTYS